MKTEKITIDGKKIEVLDSGMDMVFIVPDLK